MLLGGPAVALVLWGRSAIVVTDGELWLDDTPSGPGSIVFIPRDTDYSVRGGAEGVRFFRVVVP